MNVSLKELLIEDVKTNKYINTNDSYAYVNKFLKLYSKLHSCENLQFDLKAEDYHHIDEMLNK